MEEEADDTEERKDAMQEEEGDPEKEEDDLEKEENDIRIIAQSCRGVTRSQTPLYEHYDPAIDQFRDNKADAILLSETNIDWNLHDSHYIVSSQN